jgi:predicted dehydrogenase
MYKAVLIGLGKISWKFGSDINSNSSLCHKDAFEKNSKIDLVGGFSPFKSETENFSNETGVKSYNNLELMFDEQKPDIVSICSPVENHSNNLKKCLQYNISMIWLEKPAAQSVLEIKKLEEYRSLISPTSKVLVNYQRRYTDIYRSMKGFISNSSYGKCQLVNINYSRGLVTNGSHMLDLLDYFFPNEVMHILWVEKGRDIQNPSFILRLSNKLVIHVTGLDLNFHNLDVIITFEKARLSIIHGGMTLRHEVIKENDLFDGYYRLYDEKTDDLRVKGFDSAFDNSLENLIESYENNSEPLSNLKTSLRSQSLIEIILNQSSAV